MVLYSEDFYTDSEICICRILPQSENYNEQLLIRRMVTHIDLGLNY